MTAMADIAPRSPPSSSSSSSPSPARRLQTSARTVRASEAWRQRCGGVVLRRRWCNGCSAVARPKHERGVGGTGHAHMMPSSSPAKS